MFAVIGQTVACVTALISLSWALVAYHKALRYSLPNKANMTSTGIAMQFCWHLFTISARVAAMALFASTFVHWVFILAGIHWMIMLVWILRQRTQFCESRFQEFFFDIVMALVYIFCYVNVIHGQTRLRYLFYYVVVYIENAIMILGWYIFGNHEHVVRPSGTHCRVSRILHWNRLPNILLRLLPPKQLPALPSQPAD